MKFVLFFAVAAFIVTMGDSIRCYDCVFCNDPFVYYDFIRTCNGTFCTKAILGDQKKEKTIVFDRSCAANVTDDLKNDFRKTYYCETDFCNSASSSIITASVLLMSIILPLLIS